MGDRDQPGRHGLAAGHDGPDRNDLGLARDRQLEIDHLIGRRTGSGLDEESGCRDVEDDAGVERVATRQLERLGYRTLHARDAAGALEILRTTEAVALLFTDIVLPGGVNGIQLSQDAASVRDDLKVLFVSAYSEAEVWRDGEDVDAELITKPYSRPQLASAIHRALNG